MNNPLSFNQNLLNYIDALQDENQIKALSSCLDVNAITNVFWQAFVGYFNAKTPLERQKAQLKCDLVNRYFGAFIPMNPKINFFNAPHGFSGIFISQAAKIGKGCTIFQNVTIGSNTLPDSKNAGSPTIGDNVYIGAGATIIGNVKIGNNVRIGAGCSVTRDIPDNCTVVQSAPTVLQKDTTQDNRWLSITDYQKLKAAEQSRKLNTPPVANISFVDLFGVQEKNIYRVADETTAAKYADAFKILFCGDLILLEDQVKRAFDGKGLYLNFPDAFADAVKNAGFNLVTTANNHVLDMGVDGALRTIKTLNAKQIDFIGSYPSAADKANSRVKIVDKDGVKMAILASRRRSC